MSKISVTDSETSSTHLASAEMGERIEAARKALRELASMSKSEAVLLRHYEPDLCESFLALTQPEDVRAALTPTLTPASAEMGEHKRITPVDPSRGLTKFDYGRALKEVMFSSKTWEDAAEAFMALVAASTPTPASRPDPASCGGGAETAISDALALFRSAIKSGENWTQACEVAFVKARAGLVTLAAHPTSAAPVVPEEAGPRMLAILKRIDAFWLEEAPGGPDKPDVWGGIGCMSSETVEIWQEIRACIALTPGRAAPVVEEVQREVDFIRRQVAITCEQDRNETKAKQDDPLPTGVEISLSHVLDAVGRIEAALTPERAR